MKLIYLIKKINPSIDEFIEIEAVEIEEDEEEIEEKVIKVYVKLANISVQNVVDVL